MIKACRICHVHKDETQFYLREDGGYRHECKGCRAELGHLKFLNESPEDRKSRLARCSARYQATRTETAEFNRQQKRLKLAFLESVKSAPCVDCDQSFESFVMDFDHVPGRGQKKAVISRMLHGTYTLESMKAEIIKCDLVCANCHRRRSARRGWTRENKRTGRSTTPQERIRRIQAQIQDVR